MLNKSKGNMYEWVTHTWNPIKGACPHDCSYCYMKRWGKLNPVRLDEKEFKTYMGDRENVVFVGSSCDMWAENISSGYIRRVLDYLADNYPMPTYLFQSKYPRRFFQFSGYFPRNTLLCTTIETNRHYKEIMGNSPHPMERAKWMNRMSFEEFDTYVTIEPIMDFDIEEMLNYIAMCLPTQVNIGADSGGHKLPEPGRDKLQELINYLSEFTEVKLKKNLNRLLKK
jgi:DNA repair photolyase